MKSLKHCFSTVTIDCDPDLLDVIKIDQEYQIFQGNQPLLTPNGHFFAHSSERFIRSMITDLILRKVVNCSGIPSSALFSFKTDMLDSGKDPFTSELDAILDADLLVRLKASGKSAFQSFKPDEPLFNFSFITLSGLIIELNSLTAKLMGEISIDESNANPFTDLIRLYYSNLNPWKKTAVQVLSCMHNAGIVLPMAMVSGQSSVADYVKGLISLKICRADQYQEIYSEASDVRNFLDGLNETRVAGPQLQPVIQAGEGDTIEFKSTLRWDIRAGKTNQAIERACLKSISAFLNSKGGVLLIGVRDDGSIEGIETDKFVNEDKFLLHLWTLIRTCLGRDFSPYIRTILEKVEDKTVCLIDCQPSVRPVFLRQPGFDEEMFIRIGPSSNALDISEALQYIRERFPEKL
jgi:hypothetical protein